METSLFWLLLDLCLPFVYSHVFSTRAKIGFNFKGKRKCSDFKHIVHTLESDEWFNIFSFGNYVANKSLKCHFWDLSSSCTKSHCSVQCFQAILSSLYRIYRLIKNNQEKGRLSSPYFLTHYVFIHTHNFIDSIFPFLMPGKYSSCT